MSGKINFPVATILRDGRAICDAGLAHTELHSMFRAGLLTETNVLLAQVTGAVTTQKDRISSIGVLTAAQNGSLLELMDKMSALRKIAKKAFATDKVRLFESFQVGVHKPMDLASVLKRAKIMLASCKKTENAGPLADKGWLAADSTELGDLIDALSGTDETQETAKAVKLGSTVDLDAKILDLLEHITTIQNVVDVHNSARDPANRQIRAEFRLGIFPPSPHTGGVPNIPRKLKVKPGPAGSGRFDLGWNIADRADDYVSTIKNKATGQTIATQTTAETKITMTLAGIPAGTAVEVTLTARNAAGESKPTRPVTAKVP